MRVVAKAAALFVLLGISGSPAKDRRSLTDFESGPKGQEISVPDPEGSNAGSLDERLVLARASIKALTESLAMSNNEAEIFRRQAADLQLKLDAYGLTGIEKEPEKIEQRLLAAVRDLRLLKKQNEDAVNQLIQLSEAIQILIKTSEGINPQSRVSVETEIRKTKEILRAPAAQGAGSNEASMTDAAIVDVKDDLSLVVANIGAKQGVKVGMPFQVLREGNKIADVRVVDVRERICGAVIQNLKSEKQTVKSGDRLRVDAKQ